MNENHPTETIRADMLSAYVFFVQVSSNSPEGSFIACGWCVITLAAHPAAWFAARRSIHKEWTW